jgi:glutamate N-acetyltransferase/amino-acid N-acetyltransferase
MVGSNEFSVPGFKVGGKRGKKYGVAIAVSEEKATCSLMVTSNKIKAAPLELSIEHAKDNIAQGVVITSGNANAFTGERGTRDANRICGLVSDDFGLDKKDVVVNSTGIIGQWLEMDEIEKLVEEVAMSLNGDDSRMSDAADAMRTTDSFKKTSSKTIEVDGQAVRLTGIAKGAGMIAPQLAHATMIAVILTDAVIPKEKIDSMLKEAVDQSFNMIIVDGDTSTNDMVVLLANGKAKNNRVEESLQAALNEVCLELAKLIVKDGEGATKFFTMEIRGAGTMEDAKVAARVVAGSTLVKTALFGENPNWGRIIAAIGYSGAKFDQTRLSLSVRNESIEAVLVKDGGGIALKGTEEVKRAKEILKSREVTFTADLGLGEFSATAFGCDLGHNYVKINAEFTT